MKWLICTILCVLFVSPLVGQFRVGARGGLNISDVVITNYINPDAESDYQPKAGIHLGVVAQTTLNERFSVAGELLYSNKGVKAISNINLHYINIPIITQYHVAPKWTLDLGPELGYLFAAKSDYGDVSNIWNNKLDFGLDAGVSYSFSEEVGITVRYYAGFSSVIDFDTRDVNNNPGEPVKYQNRVLQFSLRYMLPAKD